MKELEELKKQYKNDEDALEMIEMAERDIKYIKAQGPNYKGQTAAGRLNELKAILHDWF